MKIHLKSDINDLELHQAKRGLMVIFKKKNVMYISAFDYYEGLY